MSTRPPLAARDPLTNPLSLLSDGPSGTILFLLLSLVGAIVCVVGESSLNYETYVLVSAGSAGVVSIGRGLAVKGDAQPLGTLLDRFNAVPWATIVVYIHALVGLAVLLIGESSLNYEEYAKIMAVSYGTLVVGRGIAAYKKDRDPLFRGETDPAFLAHPDQEDSTETVPDGLSDPAADDELGAPEEMPPPSR